MSKLEQVLEKYKGQFHPVVHFDPVVERLYPFNFTSSNQELSVEEIADTARFSLYVNRQLSAHQAAYGIGGYRENRVLYRRSSLFNAALVEGSPVVPLPFTTAPEENRSIHLGIDIWGPAGSPVLLPLSGEVHSLADNNHFGDYGPAIIVRHQLDTVAFYTLYGHLSRSDLDGLQPGKQVEAGEIIGHFGEPYENGDWPPHLHFQVILDMGQYQGDYPGVCSLSESENYFSNCPDPDLLLNLVQYTKTEKLS